MIVAGGIGVLVGFVTVAFSRVSERGLLNWVLRQPAWIQAMAPGLGLVAAFLVLRWPGRGVSPSTSDEYIKAVPTREGAVDPRPVPARLVASILTIGSGNAMGPEAPSIYAGAAIGTALQRRLSRILQVDPHAALVAGAAAGVAAIFKAPATGAIFAMEVPFQNDLARNSLMPALVGSATGYTVFVAFNGTEPLFAVAGTPPINLRDLGAAVLVGLGCGVGARMFAALVEGAKRVANSVSPLVRLPVAVAVLAGLVAASRAAFDGEALSLGAGIDALRWSLDPERALWAVALLGTIRVVATLVAVVAGGAGGVFLPLVVQGALTGRVIGGWLHVPDQSLLIVVGVAAFLGAGYRVPLAAVMFVAEATGRPGFVVPGLLAAVVAQLLMGDASVSAYQQRRRAGHIEMRAALPVSRALGTDPATCGPEDSLAQFFTEHVAMARRQAVPVVKGRTYLGMMLLDDALAVAPVEWADHSVEDHMRRDAPRAMQDWTLGQVLAVMVNAGVDHVPVLTPTGELAGIVTTEAILELEQLLDRLGSDG